MIQSNFKQTINSITNEFWMKSRSGFALVGSLMIFGFWYNPVIKDVRNKNSCVNTYSDLYSIPEVIEKFNAKQLKDFGLNTIDFANALAYQTCTNQNAVGK